MVDVRKAAQNNLEFDKEKYRLETNRRVLQILVFLEQGLADPFFFAVNVMRNQLADGSSKAVIPLVRFNRPPSYYKIVPAGVRIVFRVYGSRIPCQIARSKEFITPY